MSDARTGLPVRLFDEDNLPYTANNPLPVTLEESEGEELHLHDKAVAVLKNTGTANHDYTVTAAKDFLLSKVLISSSGRAKFELFVESGVGTGIFNSVAVGFTSTSLLNSAIDFGAVPKKVPAGVKIRVTKSNLDNQDQDLYDTIVGVEKAQ